LRTWTPAALSSERRGLSGSAWRLVEAQHRVSTMKLVDTLPEQHLLESILDATKPPVPAECASLHYLLSTPFRYGAPYPAGSRVRRAGMTAGVFYASVGVATAVAEMAFHRLLFFADSSATPWPADAGDYTAFSTKFRTRAGLDLARPPFDNQRARWTHPTDYAPCQTLADTAREAGIDALRYPSARDPDDINVALLACRTFVAREPLDRQTWRLALNAHGVRAVCDFPDAHLEFTRDRFANDPRIREMKWDRM
jgi:hypothetical protein